MARGSIRVSFPFRFEIDSNLSYCFSGSRSRSRDFSFPSHFKTVSRPEPGRSSPEGCTAAAVSESARRGPAAWPAGDQTGSLERRPSSSNQDDAVWTVGAQPPHHEVEIVSAGPAGVTPRRGIPASASQAHQGRPGAWDTGGRASASMAVRGPSVALQRGKSKPISLRPP